MANGTRRLVITEYGLKNAKAILYKHLTEHQLDQLDPKTVKNILSAMEEFASLTEKSK